MSDTSSDLVSPEQFRSLVGSFATGVTVVTSAHEGEASGMTVSAFSSVSMDPPLVLVCLTRGKPTTDLIEGSRRFVVNILAADQQTVSDQFAYLDAEERLFSVAYEQDDTGLPVLDGAVAHLVCRVQRTEEAGDHLIFIGEVESGDVSDGDPLLYYRGAYLG
ncbi:MAG: flavin reductase family protein [Acidimicrobiia bacterium]|nr:flavin reductase family protein [Acidimicrobiia bacterium]